MDTKRANGNSIQDSTSGSTNDLAINDDSVDISVLTSFEEEHADGEPDIVIELIDLYLNDVPPRLKAMRDALIQEDKQSLRRIAHNLKGSSSSLGAGQMALLCGQIESNVDAALLEEVNASLASVEQEFERVRSAFVAERHKRQTIGIGAGNP